MDSEDDTEKNGESMDIVDDLLTSDNMEICGEQINAWIERFKGWNGADQEDALYRLIHECQYKQVVYCRDIADDLTRKDIIEILPDCLGLNIMAYLNPLDLSRCGAVSKKWNRISRDPSLWKRHLNKLKQNHDKCCSYHHNVNLAASLCSVFRPEEQWRMLYIYETLLRRSWMSDRHGRMMHNGNSDRRQYNMSITSISAINDQPAHRQLSESLHTEPSSAHRAAQLTASSDVPQQIAQQMALRSSQRHTSQQDAPTTISTSNSNAQFDMIDTLRAHDEHVITCLLFNNRHIVTASDDGCVRIWWIAKEPISTPVETDATDDSSLYYRDAYVADDAPLTGHRGGVWCIVMNDRYVVSGSTDRNLRVWSIDSKQCVMTLRGHQSTVRCLAMHGEIVVSGSRDGTLRSWDISTTPLPASNRCLHVFTGHTAAIRCVSFAPDNGQSVVSGCYDFTVRVWNVASGTCRLVLIGHENRVYSLQVGERYIASGSLDTTIRLWDIDDGQCLHVLRGHHSLVGVLDMCEHRNILVSGNADSTIRSWSLDTGQCTALLAGANAHSNVITGICHNRYFIVSSGDDGLVKLWDINTGMFIRNIIRLDSAGQGGVVWNIGCSDSKLFCAAGSRNGTEDSKLIVICFEDLWRDYLKRQKPIADQQM